MACQLGGSYSEKKRVGELKYKYKNTKRGKQKMTDEDTEERHFTKGGKALLTQTEKLDPQLPVTTGKILNS